MTLWSLMKRIGQRHEGLPEVRRHKREDKKGLVKTTSSVQVSVMQNGIRPTEADSMPVLRSQRCKIAPRLAC